MQDNKKYVKKKEKKNKKKFTLDFEELEIFWD